MGKTSTFTDPVAFKAQQDITQATAKLKRAIKFMNVARIDDIIKSGQKILSIHKDTISMEAMTNWSEQVTKATEFRLHYEKHQAHTN